MQSEVVRIVAGSGRSAKRRRVLYSRDKDEVDVRNDGRDEDAAFSTVVAAVVAMTMVVVVAATAAVTAVVVVARGTNAKTRTSERSPTKAAVTRARGSRHFCPTAEDT